MKKAHYWCIKGRDRGTNAESEGSPLLATPLPSDSYHISLLSSVIKAVAFPFLASQWRLLKTFPHHTSRNILICNQNLYLANLFCNLNQLSLMRLSPMNSSLLSSLMAFKAEQAAVASPPSAALFSLYLHYSFPRL